MEPNPKTPDGNPKGQQLEKHKSEFAELFSQPISFGQAIYRGLYRSNLEKGFAEWPVQQRNDFLKGIERYLEPWPKWVLKIAAEILHVYFPKIPTKTIEEMLLCGHFYILEAKLDGSNRSQFPQFPEIEAGIIGAMCGHMAALIVDFRKQAEEAYKDGRLSKKRYAYYSKGFSLEQFQQELSPIACDFFGMRPTGIVDFNLGFAKAMQNTFGQDGQLRETTLTEIYSKIVSDWPTIEELSGPTALCEYLDPLLRGSSSDPAMKLDRVNKICQRMGITFKPFVNGQACPPSSSVSPS